MENEQQANTLGAALMADSLIRRVSGAQACDIEALRKRFAAAGITGADIDSMARNVNLVVAKAKNR